MKTIPNQRRARPCLQAWHLAGVAPTLVAALAFPGTAKAAIDRTAVQQRAEPSGLACSAVRLEDLEALTELGCVPSMPSVTASEAAAFVSSEPVAPALQPPLDAVDTVARCAIWTTVPDLDVDVAVPSYCNAPPQLVVAAPSRAAPVVQPAIEAADQPGFDDSALAGGFYAMDDIHAQPPLAAAEQVAITDRIDTPPRGTIVSRNEAHGESQSASDFASSSRPSRSSDSEAFRGTEESSSAESISSIDAAGSTEAVSSTEAAGSTETLGSAKTSGGTDLASSVDGPVDFEGQRATASTSSYGAFTAYSPAMRAARVHDDVGAAVSASYSASSGPIASAAEAPAVLRPVLDPPAGVGCITERDVELDSAMPTYCEAAVQTVVAARTLRTTTHPDEVQPAGRQLHEPAADAEKVLAFRQACAAASEDLADSAMPSYCIAPEQTILADRSEASNVKVLAGRVNSTQDPTAEAVTLPEGLLGAKMVASDQLSETRGGFETTDRGQTLRISFGIERAIFVNGALVSTSTLALDGLARMTNVGAGAQGANVRAVSSTANVVHNGADNTLSIAPQNLPAGALVLQNSLSNQRLDANTVVNAVVEASGLLRATRLEAAMREATTGALRR